MRLIYKFSFIFISLFLSFNVVHAEEVSYDIDFTNFDPSYSKEVLNNISPFFDNTDYFWWCGINNKNYFRCSFFEEKNLRYVEFRKNGTINSILPFNLNNTSMKYGYCVFPDGLTDDAITSCKTNVENFPTGAINVNAVRVMESAVPLYHLNELYLPVYVSNENFNLSPYLKLNVIYPEGIIENATIHDIYYLNHYDSSNVDSESGSDFYLKAILYVLLIFLFCLIMFLSFKFIRFILPI